MELMLGGCRVWKGRAGGSSQDRPDKARICGMWVCRGDGGKGKMGKKGKGRVSETINHTAENGHCDP